MPILYQKPYLNVDGQIELLKKRGMEISDKTLARKHLERIGYYRLSGYWYCFLSPSSEEETFKPETSFKSISDLYVFDKRLRLLCLDAIERIEIAVRVQIALILGKRDPYSYLNPDQLDRKWTNSKDYQEWMRRFEEQLSRSKENFVKRFQEKYDPPVPIWMAIELWDFGMMSIFLSGLKAKDKNKIAEKYHIPKRELIVSWMRSINHLRNICAHHSRLWNTLLVDKPKVVKRGEIPYLDHLANDLSANGKVYTMLAIIQFLLRQINPETSWAERLKDHVRTFPEVAGVISIRQAGFPDGWQDLPLWQKTIP